MLKPVKWSSFAEEDFALILEYLHQKWNSSVAFNFVLKLEKCILNYPKKSSTVSFFK